MTIRIHTLVIFGFLFTIQSAFTTQSVFSQTLTIKVVEAEQQQPLTGVTLQLREKGQSSKQIAKHLQFTNAKGVATFHDLATATYDIEASYVGLATVKQTFSFPQTRELTLTLSEKDLPQDEIVVTAQRGQAQLDAMTVTNLTNREFESRPAMMKDLPVLFSETPSVTYYSENGNGVGYSYMRIRGFDQRRIAVSVNGIPQNDAEDHNVYWINFFDMQGAISDVQIQRGASSSFYGSSGIGGAINIIALPYKPERYAEIHAGYGTYGTKRLSVEANSGLIKGKTIVFGRLSRMESEGYRENAWAKFTRFFVGATHYTSKSSLTLQAFGGPQSDGLAYYGISKADNSDPTKRRSNYSAAAAENERFHQPHIELLHELRISPEWTFSQKWYGLRGTGYFDFDATYRSPKYLRLPSSFQNLTAQDRDLPLYEVSPTTTLLQRATVENTDIGWLPAITKKQENQETTLGAETRFHRSIHWGRIQEASADIASDLQGEGAPRFYEYKGEKVVTALYGKHWRQFSPQWAIQGDVQISFQQYRLFDEKYYNQSFSVPYFFVNPRVGATYRWREKSSVYASLAFAGREPRLKELYDGEEAGAGSQPQFVQQNGQFDFTQPLVKPEYLLNFEWGAARREKNYRLSANVYGMFFRNEIVPSGGLDQFGVPRNGNASRTQHIGLETEFAMRLLKQLDISGNASLGSHRFKEFTEFADGTPQMRDGNTIAGFPAFLANLKATYRAKSWSFSSYLQHCGKQFVDNSNGLESGVLNEELVNDSFTVLNASILYEALPQNQLTGLQLGLDINNVLDQKILLFGNSNRVFFPLATRNVFLSVKYVIR